MMNNKRKVFYDILHHPNQALEAGAKKNIVYRAAVKFAVFIRILIAEYAHNHCTNRASGIAFMLLITLIPLISTVAFIFTGITDVSPAHVEEVMTTLLPFAPPVVMGYITEFFVSAQKLRGIGIGVLIFMAMGLFGIVEQSLNSIWKVTRSRTFFSRLRAFTMVIVYSPILFLVSYQLRKSGIFGMLPSDVFIMRIPPIIFATLAFAVMFWFIPNTRVRAPSAFLGGIIACALFELERWGFGYYVSFSIRAQTVYGTFGLLVFFLVSIYFTAMLFLVGAQITYIHQNFRPLLRSAQRWDRRVGDYRSYITMRMVIDCVRAFIKETPPPTLRYFCDKYELTSPQAMGILNWLIHQKFIHQVYGTKQFVPAKDFENDTVNSVFTAIEDQYHRIPANPKDYTKDYLTKFISDYSRQRQIEGDMTFGALVELLDRKEKRMAGSASGK